MRMAFILASTETAKETGVESLFGTTTRYSKASGKMARRMALEYGLPPKAVVMRAIGRTIGNLGRVFFITKNLSTMVISKTFSSTDKVNRSSRMEIVTRAPTLKESHKVLAGMNGQTVIFTREASKMVSDLGLARFSAATGMSMKGYSSKTLSTARENRNTIPDNTSRASFSRGRSRGGFW